MISHVFGNLRLPFMLYDYFKVQIIYIYLKASFNIYI